MPYTEDNVIDITGEFTMETFDCVDCDDCLNKIMKQKQNMKQFLNIHPEIKGITSVVTNDSGKTIRIILNRETS